MTNRLTLVCLPPQDDPIYFVLDWELDEHMVEDRQCPTDLFKSAFLVASDGDTDPHGIMEFIRVFDRPAFLDRGHYTDDEWRPVIPEVFAREASGWQPIATVPHDTDVQIASGDVVTSGLFESDGVGGGFWHVQSRLEDYFASNPPTHWMPLSATPPQS